MVDALGQSIGPYKIMCMVSMPAMRVQALQIELNPSISPGHMLTKRFVYWIGEMPILSSEAS